MRTYLIRTTVIALFLCAAATTQAQVCVTIDESHDTLNRDDRAAAVLLLNRQFASAGEQVEADCPTPYVLAHVKLGNTITVTLSGPKGSREGTALGLDDLPALYSQMVRSLETGRPMTGLGVVDRTNVTAAQATAQRVHSDGFFYARLGYGGIFAGRTYGVPSFGLGYRAEIDKIAIDVSFLNFQISNSDFSYTGGSADSASLVKLSGLYMVHRDASSTPYVGGGLSWGHTSVFDSQLVTNTPGTGYTYTTGGDGSGLQGELSAGYEFARATTIRMFVQADAILPFYSVNSQTFSSRGVPMASTGRWTPSLLMSVGLGWQRGRK
jgi:hypothetical protein